MRDRLLLPLLIPVGAAGAIFLLIFSVSRILLYTLESGAYSEETGKYVATGIAIAGAMCILIVCTLLAQAPKISPRAIYSFTALPASIIIAFGLWIAVRPSEGEGQAAENAAAVTSPTEIATDNKFSQTAITVPAGQQVTLTFENRGQAVHNWRAKGVSGADGKEIKTQLLAGGKSETLTFTIAAPGTYDFDCEVHPTEMKGTLAVVNAPAGAAASEGAAGGQAITATDNKFDKTALTVKANAEASVTLQNEGSAVHNWRVKGVTSKDGKDIKSELIGGGKSETVTFIIEKPGKYDYDCEVHPTEMKGTLTVQ